MNRIFPDIYGDLTNYSLLDPEIELGEIFHETQIISNNQTETVKPSSQWAEFFQYLESSLSNGIVWQTEQYDFQPSPELESSFYNTAITHLDSHLSKSFEETLEDFDKWTGTPVDILSPYGDIDFGNNFFIGDFSVDVPVKIYSEDNNYVLTADVPWIKVDSFAHMDLYSEKLNLKSVLSSLPISINSQKVRASFQNGEFKIEMPRADTIEQKKAL